MRVTSTFKEKIENIYKIMKIIDYRKLHYGYEFYIPPLK